MSGHSIATAASWPHGVGRKPLNVWGLNLTCSGRVQCAMTIIKSPSIQQTWLNHGFLQPAARSPEPLPHGRGALVLCWLEGPSGPLDGVPCTRWMMSSARNAPRLPSSPLQAGINLASGGA